MGVDTHGGSAGNGADGGDWGIYRPPPEIGCIIYCDSSYHGIVSCGGEEYGNAPIQAIVGKTSRYILGIRVGHAAAEGGGG